MKNNADKILNAVIGGFTGSFIGIAAATYFRFRNNMGLYLMTSAPWYVSLIVPGIACGLIVLTAVIIKFILKNKTNR